MSSVKVVDMQGAETGTRELADAVFGVERPNMAVMHQALIRQLANARQGTHATKTRGEVRGGGRKPWRQKGTGRARQGSTRAPHWTGGGTVFGPTPHTHKQDMPRKQRRLALRSALSVKAQEQSVVVLHSVELEEPRTKAIVELLAVIEAGRRVLLVLGSHHDALERSARNIPEVLVVLASNLSVRDLISADTVVMTTDAVEHIEQAWS
ncbi:MAG: 50S ribosomal protein L4 [Candidatus Dormibacteria bacterium]